MSISPSLQIFPHVPRVDAIAVGDGFTLPMEEVPRCITSGTGVMSLVPLPLVLFQIVSLNPSYIPRTNRLVSADVRSSGLAQV